MPTCDTQTLYHICYFIPYTYVSQNGYQEDFYYISHKVDKIAIDSS